MPSSKSAFSIEFRIMLPDASAYFQALAKTSLVAAIFAYDMQISLHYMHFEETYDIINMHVHVMQLLQQVIEGNKLSLFAPFKGCLYGVFGESEIDMLISG
ncbi:hypothetical protein WUBG_08175 [Wuchereria bancrofti]|uniref:Uncharacterized protein n=1 Tax=Wuchereria bancrofti TaxID=6293 RepID=J9EFG6_WUCBA|nr:hypothetical protein WUBG_08175 [Wuchereria bancrofti]